MIVYSATFESGKVYVGATSRSLNLRKNDHKNSHVRVKNKFYNALLKYGFDSVSWSVLGVYENKKEMFLHEKHFINIFDSIHSGYNTTIGGEGRKIFEYSKQELENISRGQIKRFSNPDNRLATSLAVKKWIKNNPKKLLDISIKRLVTARHPQNRQRAREKQLNYIKNNPEAILEKNKRLSERYSVDSDLRERISKSLGGTRIRAIKDGVSVGIYVSLSECVRCLGLSLGNVSMVLSGKRNHTHGYTFERITDV